MCYLWNEDYLIKRNKNLTIIILIFLLPLKMMLPFTSCPSIMLWTPIRKIAVDILVLHFAVHYHFSFVSTLAICLFFKHFHWFHHWLFNSRNKFVGTVLKMLNSLGLAFPKCWRQDVVKYMTFTYKSQNESLFSAFTG